MIPFLGDVYESTMIADFKRTEEPEKRRQVELLSTQDHAVFSQLDERNTIALFILVRPRFEIWRNPFRRRYWICTDHVARKKSFHGFEKLRTAKA
jgi:hypothetical protein